FPTARRAAAFAAGLSADHSGVFALSALAVPGTASSLFSPQARQAATSRQAGPFVILTVAGYAHRQPTGGRPRPRRHTFPPAAPPAAASARPLTVPVPVNCRTPQWVG